MKSIFYAFLILSSPFVGAEEAARPSLDLDCQLEKTSFCRGKENPSDFEKCLLAHDQELSSACKQAIQRLIGARKEAASRGGGALTSFGGLNAMGPPLPLFSYDGRYMPGESGPTLTENRANLSIPVFKDDTDTFALSLAAGQLHLGEQLYLDSGTEVPSDLYRMELGTQYFHQLQEKKSWGLRGSIGYAGDKPSKVPKDASYSFSANYGFPGSGNGYWMLMVFMANNSPLINFLPIPGFLYIYKTPTFTGMFGFPILSLQWTPIAHWAYSLSVFGPTIQSEVAYGERDHIQVFGGYSLAQQSYIPSVRPEDRDRLTLAEQKTGAGFRFLLAGKMLCEFQAGRSFNRSIYIGKGLMKKDGGSTPLNEDWFMTWGGKVAF